MSLNVTEFERKWLLKKKPKIKFDSKILIIQFYLDGLRYRSSYYNNKGTYEKIKKVSIGIGHNEELNCEQITSKEWWKNYKLAEKVITKTRFIKNSNGLKFEIDIFSKLSLIMMEVEDVQLTDSIAFPTEIEKEIIMEVTGLKEFNNYNLAD